MMKNTVRVTIVGAGMIGLTTACTLLREYSSCPRFELTIISDKYSPDTTADISAGYWEPYGVGQLDERVLRWASYTYDIFLNEFFSNKAAKAGIMRMPAYTLYNSIDENRKKPDYAPLVRHFRLIDSHELEMFDHLKAKAGFIMSTIAVEVRFYLRELQRFLAQNSQVQFVQRRIHSFDELSDQTDLIINCSGLGARELANDLTVRPARGQIIRVSAPWIKSVYNFETDLGEGYIIPQYDSVVLGGTFQLNDWNTSVDNEDTKRILTMCSQCLPALKAVRYGKVQVGLRPYRDDGVRLEYEQAATGMKIVHCYGHSGSGVTLSWGCAKDVVDLVKKIVPPSSPSSKIRSDQPEHEQLWRLIDPRPKIFLLSKY